jgi:hypothetical protein
MQYKTQTKVKKLLSYTYVVKLSCRPPINDRYYVMFLIETRKGVGRAHYYSSLGWEITQD